MLMMHCNRGVGEGKVKCKSKLIEDFVLLPNQRFWLVMGYPHR